MQRVFRMHINGHYDHPYDEITCVIDGDYDVSTIGPCDNPFVSHVETVAFKRSGIGPRQLELPVCNKRRDVEHAIREGRFYPIGVA